MIASDVRVEVRGGWLPAHRWAGLLTLAAVFALGWFAVLTRPAGAVAASWWPASGLALGLGLLLPRRRLWLAAVAYPLWRAGTLAGNPAEEMTKVFLWTPVVIAAVPWGYVLRHFVLPARPRVA